MNKPATLAFFLAFTVNASAQSPVVLTDHDGNVVNGATLVGWGAPGAFELSVGLGAESDESFNQIVNVKRYELDVVDSTKNMFCWGVCYNPIYADSLPLWVSDDWVNMDPDSVYESFHAYYQPHGHEGVSCFRYVWFSTSDPNDSTWADICFNTMTGIDDGAAPANSFSVYPNPSADGTITIEHPASFTSGIREVVIHDLLGNEMSRKAIGTGDENTRIAASTLKPGVYFASLVENGGAVATRRMVVGH